MHRSSGQSRKCNLDTRRTPDKLRTQADTPDCFNPHTACSHRPHPPRIASYHLPMSSHPSHIYVLGDPGNRPGRAGGKSTPPRTPPPTRPLISRQPVGRVASTHRGSSGGLQKSRCPTKWATGADCPSQPPIKARLSGEHYRCRRRDDVRAARGDVETQCRMIGER